MKLVSAYIKPFKLDDVREALTKTGVKGLSITEIKGFGRQKGQTEIYRGAEYTVTYLPKMKIETLVEDKVVKKVVEAILTSAKTARIGDGKVFVTKVEDAIRIRTGESGSKAL